MSGPSARPRAGHVLSWSNVAYTVPTTRAALSSNALAVVDADSGLEAASCHVSRLTRTAAGQEGCTSRVRQRVLQGVSGMARPGEIVAILGGSGSGKTSLLDSLAFRTTAGTVSGEIRLNERIVDRSLASEFIGYVTQADRLMPHLTVRETLTYLARLRLVGSNRRQIDEHVAGIMSELEVLHVADTYVGDGFVVRGLSGGQRRRVTIGTQLLIDPTTLLLDEPTSGLDSTTAFHIVENLRALAQRGRTIVVTIHQPASEMLSLLDRVMILSQGKVVFNGTSQQALGHFSSLGLDCPHFTNPLDFFIDITSINTRTEKTYESSRGQVARLVDAYDKSVYAKELHDAISSHQQTASEDHVFHAREKLGLVSTVYILMSRLLVNLSRHASGLQLRIFQMVLFALLLWLYMGHFGDDQNSIQNRFGYLYETLTSGIFLGFFNACGLYPDIRDVFLREHRDGLYSPLAFILSYTIHAFPTDIISVCLFAIWSFWITGINSATYSALIFLYTAICATNFGESLGIMLCTIFKNTVCFIVLGPSSSSY